MFGGPQAHIALLRDLCVTRRGWIGERDFEDAVAACNLLPGPASTQMAIYCAWRVRGRLGAVVEQELGTHQPRPLRPGGHGLHRLLVRSRHGRNETANIVEGRVCSLGHLKLRPVGALRISKSRDL